MKSTRTIRFARAAQVGLMAAAWVFGGIRPGVASDNDPATSNQFIGGITIPYEGTLVLDGGPYTGQVTVEFELWDHPVRTTAPATLRYSERQTVTFRDGRFSVEIGAGVQQGPAARTMNAAILDGDALYLAIRVRDALGQFVPLSGRQALMAAPYSAWTQNAANLSVPGVLAAGEITANASSLTSTDLTVDLFVEAPSLTVTNPPVDSCASVMTNCFTPDFIESLLRVDTSCPVPASGRPDYMASWQVVQTGCSGGQVRINKTCCAMRWTSPN